jgi:ribosome recycling factor
LIKELVHDGEKRMRSAIESLEDDLAGVRTGRASPALIEKLSVEYYGSPVPLMQLATIGVPEPRQLMIKPFDLGSVKDIEKAILASDLGLTPMSDGKVIRLNLPPLTEDRRHDLIRFVNNRLEEARISIRNIRRDSIKDLRDFEQEKMISEDDLKNGEEEIQKLTDKYVEEVGEVGKAKEDEIMEI